jgi:catechol 2,3-dioxygenase-like lactoylglutathione lyase family enzyme
MSSPLIYKHGFVALGVRDVDASAAFYQDVCRLAVTERRSGRTFLTGNRRHHWLVLERRDEPGLIRLGYQATNRQSLDELRQRLEKAGVDWSDGGNLTDDRVRGGVRFRDPFGIEVEVYEEMMSTASSPISEEDGLVDLLHAVVFVSDVEAARDFYRETLSLRRSDQIETFVAFMRGGDRFHHTLALARGDSGRLDHFAVLVRDLDTVMRLRIHAMQRNVLGDDVVRHTASGSISVYFRDEANGIGIEFCTGHLRIEDDEYDGRLLQASPETVNMWARPFASASAPSDAGDPDVANGGTAAARVGAGRQRLDDA